jgi:hypothetical protein
MIQIFKNLKSKVLTLGIVLAGMISAGIFMQSCSQDNDFSEITINEDENSLNLIAPNGEKIADNIVSLKNETAQIIAETFGIEKEFEITNLNYLPTEKGYVVFVEYKTSDGIIKNYVKAHNAFVNYSTNNLQIRHLSNPRLKSGNEGSSYKKVKFECLPNGNCNSCIIQGVYDPSTGENTIRCSCEECQMRITYS